MEKKSQIFSKLNIKDYTKHLEKILEKKEFSVDTKNLLLSMLYKIENAYNDYNKTKVEVPNKNDFIEDIFSIIENKCNDIIVAEFNSEASRMLKESDKKYIIDKQNEKIIAFGNELLVLNCILEMADKSIIMPQEKQILMPAISNLLNLGNRINKSEIIRDFDGWSWNILIKEIPGISVNLIYQTLLYLTDYEFMYKWINNDSNLADYLELLYIKLKENYGEKRAEKFINLFCKLAIDITISEDDEQLKFWKEKRKAYEAELDKLQDKTKYLEEETIEKKEYTKQIENIDKMLNNKELLKEEYKKRNENLPNKEKIFSISHLADRLDKERQELLEKIKQCNILIDPKGYVARKHNVERKVEFLKQLDLNKKQKRSKSLIELSNIFLECFQIKIAKAQTKKEITDDIYKLRYYCFLPINEEGTNLKEVKNLRDVFEKCTKLLLEKAKKLDVLDIITEDEEINKKIILSIFDSKMIDLDHMVIETRVTDNKLYADYYDEKVLDTTIQIESNRTVKLKKKTKLFI